MSTLFAFSFGPMELCIVGGIMLLLFGNRLPSTMRSLGQSVVSFRQGMNDPSSESNLDEEPAKQPATEVRT